MCRSIPCIILHNNIFSFSQIIFFLKLQRTWSVFLLYYVLTILHLAAPLRVSTRFCSNPCAAQFHASFLTISIFPISPILFKLQQKWSVFVLYFDYFIHGCTSPSLSTNSVQTIFTHVPLHSMHHSPYLFNLTNTFKVTTKVKCFCSIIWLFYTWLHQSIYLILCKPLYPCAAPFHA